MTEAVMTTTAALSCRGLNKSFREGDAALCVLRALSMTLLAGESVAIIGASGSGKSTLLHVLGGLDVPTEGDVYWQGQALADMNEATLSRRRNETLGFVYQFHHLMREFTALENVAMPLYIRGMDKKEAENRAGTMLDRVGLQARMNHLPAELSGGERQRAAIARALVVAPACVLADEPTGNLDRQTAAKVFDLMLEITTAQGASLVVATHDPELAARTGRVLRLVDGGLQPG